MAATGLFGLLSVITGFLKIRYLADKAVIDNVVFRAHYKITCAIIFTCCLVVTANHLIGDPIKCLTEGTEDNEKVINSYCWIFSTYTIKSEKNDIIGLGNDYKKEKKYQFYYQWVPLTLFVQGILFYIPHWIWKQWEGGKIKAISDGIRGSTVDAHSKRKTSTQRLVQYIYDTLHLHNSYAIVYFFCEVLNFVNVLTNIFMLDKFLGGSFLTYGLKIFSFVNADQDERHDPMIEIFPRMTKCIFYKYGVSGSIQNHDALCILALNVVSEKIYIFLWFWFIILAIMSGAAIIYSMIIILLPISRELILQKMFKFHSKPGVKILVEETQIGDFLLLYLLGQNINGIYFNEVLKELENQLRSSLLSNGAKCNSLRRTL
ncbi:innexin inx3 [Copidosoma floridanum]|uniref:innexin inx3 n=1 Tax=Copidosoma floridanum TaxID=29053 RepID=UPI0006C98710|nr:innexin inx3 [Copidosoma floridanum]